MSNSNLEPFCKLADPSTYIACPWNMTTDAEARLHWVEFFKRHFNTILELGVAVDVARGKSAGEVAERADECREKFNARFDAFNERPADFGTVTIITLDAWRENALREAGFPDPFIDLKNRENERMLPLVATVCAQIDALNGEERFRAVVEGVFAGNIFDMGAEATAKRFLGKSPDFFAIRSALSPRPWLIDDFDALAQRMLTGPAHRKAIFFIDNAGSDFLLGAVPFVRWLAMRGTNVVIAANERPALNDMTIDDLTVWWPRVIVVEPSLAELPIELVSSGTGEPMIDLLGVSQQLNADSSDADLVILEGMGRGVESNLDAIMTCDRLNIAMLKDPMVASRHGGKVFDIVCRFVPRA
jgi:type II pantothenate kinase